MASTSSQAKQSPQWPTFLRDGLEGGRINHVTMDCLHSAGMSSLPPNAHGIASGDEPETVVLESRIELVLDARADCSF